MRTQAGVKSATAFRTISEVSDELNLPQHVLRFWETRFPQIRPLKRGGGRRYYRPEDVALLRRIQSLLYSEGYTIKGVQRLLRDGRALARLPAEPAVARPATMAAAFAAAAAGESPGVDDSLGADSRIGPDDEIDVGDAAGAEELPAGIDTDSADTDTDLDPVGTGCAISMIDAINTAEEVESGAVPVVVHAGLSNEQRWEIGAAIAELKILRTMLIAAAGGPEA
jgi:DNA-binding transcriptional MerR regulator